MKQQHFKHIPSSLYRIQLSEQCQFKLIRQAVSYFKELGIEGLYFSPYFSSASDHGYDVIDPNQINAKLGSEQDFQKLCMTILENKLFHIIDMVPNHMGIRGKNRWWMDTMEYGQNSSYAFYFDIDWQPSKPELKNKVLLPILRSSYGEVLESQEIQVSWKEGGLWIIYQDYQLPVAPHTYSFVLEHRLEDLQDFFSKNDTFADQYLEVCKGFGSLPTNHDERKLAKLTLCRKLQSLYQRSAKIRQFLSSRISFFNGTKGDSDSFNLLDQLLEIQYYRLSHWLVAAHEVNYRRFFNINDLVAIRMEEDKTFAAYHELAFELASEGKIHGMRIDHPDGLYDPQAYFEKIYSQEIPFIFIEKILGLNEKLPSNWTIAGTVGYEYLNCLGGLFINPSNEQALSSIYQNFIGEKQEFSQIVYEKKKFFSQSYMSSEIKRLSSHLERLIEHHRYYRDFTHYDLTIALQEMIAFFPVYRSYVREEDEELTPSDAYYLSTAIEKARRKAPFIEPAIFDFLHDLFLLRIEDPEKQFRRFILQFQQVTAPIMAKGLEDTAFYVYNRLLSLNEVGGDPAKFGTSQSEFHGFNIEKSKKWPFGLLPFSTHDTKRSEDVRMRLHVLSERPADWDFRVNQWSKVNQGYKQEVQGTFYPDPNLEYLIYQTLLGLWPLEKMDPKSYENFIDRCWECLLKCMREAKEHTNWNHPNFLYEKAVQIFLKRILRRHKKNAFLKNFLPFKDVVARLGLLNSLAALLLRIGSCGVFDLYQGCELWNFSLMDPDNRRKISFSKHKRLLHEVLSETMNSKLSDVLKEWFLDLKNGKLKLYLTWKGLHLRKKYKALFLKGEYIPLIVEGPYANSVVAFMRRNDGKWYIFAAMRFAATTQDCKEDPEGWQKTVIKVPLKSTLPKKIKNCLINESIKYSQADRQTIVVSCAQVFYHLPIAILGENG